MIYWHHGAFDVQWRIRCTGTYCPANLARHAQQPEAEAEPQVGTRPPCHHWHIGYLCEAFCSVFACMSTKSPSSFLKPTLCWRLDADAYACTTQKGHFQCHRARQCGVPAQHEAEAILRAWHARNALNCFGPSERRKHEAMVV